MQGTPMFQTLVVDFPLVVELAVEIPVISVLTALATIRTNRHTYF